MSIIIKINDFTDFLPGIYDFVSSQISYKINQTPCDILEFGNIIDIRSNTNIGNILCSYNFQLEFSDVYFKKVIIEPNGDIIAVIDTYDVKRIGNDIVNEMTNCFNVNVNETMNELSSLKIGHIDNYNSNYLELTHPIGKNVNFNFNFLYV